MFQVVVTIALVAGLSASGTGYGSYINDQSEVFYTTGRMNNSIAYTSPEFAGVKVTAMASLGNDVKDAAKVVTAHEGSSEVDRYYALGAKGQWGALGAGLVVSTEDFGSKGDKAGQDNSMNVTGGVNYDFGVAKVFVAANYYDSGHDRGISGEKPQCRYGFFVVQYTGYH